MSDLISRELVMKTLCERRCGNEPKGCPCGFCTESLAVDCIPSVEPERKKGRWIYEGKRGRFPACRCSECGNVENADWAILGDNVNFCPNCGARMVEEDE